MSEDKTTRIRELNDAFRQSMPRDVYLTAGVSALSDEVQTQAIWRVKTFDAFDGANDPHAEHDFGAFVVEGQKFFWKLDYYDQELKYGSEDPADEAKTRRILTIMLVEEY